jgi:hypothetical protein
VVLRRGVVVGTETKEQNGCVQMQERVRGELQDVLGSRRRCGCAGAGAGKPVEGVAARAAAVRRGEVGAGQREAGKRRCGRRGGTWHEERRRGGGGCAAHGWRSSGASGSR